MKIQKIIEAKAFPGKILYLKFADGVEGEFCFTDYFSCDKELSSELKEENYFSQVKVKLKSS